MHIYLCTWISVIWYITGLITEKVGFFLAELLYSDIGTVIYKAFNALILTNCSLCVPRARRSLSSARRSGEIPRPWEWSPSGHPKFYPRILLLGFCAFLTYLWYVSCLGCEYKPLTRSPLAHSNLSCSLLLLSFLILQKMRKYSCAKLQTACSSPVCSGE